MYFQDETGVIFFQRGLPNTKEPIVGKNCVIGFGSIIDCLDQVTIGDNCFFGHRVMILTGCHDYMKFGVERQMSGKSAPVTIGEGVWIASGAIICPGITIGDHSVIAAGAVVMRNVMPYSLMGGNPAHRIRKLK